MIDMVSFVKLHTAISAFTLLLFKKGKNVFLGKLSFGIAAGSLIIMHDRLVIFFSGVKMLFPRLICQRLMIALWVSFSPLSNALNGFLTMFLGILPLLLSGIFGIFLVPGTYTLNDVLSDTGIVSVLVTTIGVAALFAVPMQSKLIILRLVEEFKGGGKFPFAHQTGFGLHGNLPKNKTHLSCSGLTCLGSSEI